MSAPALHGGLGSSFLVVLAVLGCSDGDRLVGRVQDQSVQGGSGGQAGGEGQAGSSGQLGSGPFGAPTEITELTDPNADQQDPTLRHDELEIYFTRIVGTAPGDIWRSTRTSLSAPWAAPERVAELSSDSSDSTPEVSADGLTIYLASNRGSTATHLWIAERATLDSAWSTPVAVTNPAPGTRELSPSLDDSGLWFAVASVRGTSTNFDLYLSHRTSPSAAWGELQALSSVNSSSDDFDPALFAGATQLIFSSLRDDAGDLFQTSRATTDEPFAAPTPITELNSPVSDGDPWVSADAHRIYFASKRSGVECMYQASR